MNVNKTPKNLNFYVTTSLQDKISISLYIKNQEGTLDFWGTRKIDNEARKRYQKNANALLSLRDAYIAQKIDKTLKKGEIGTLFLGAAHEVEKFLPKTLLVEQL